MSTLKQVLTVFRETSQPLSLNQIARELAIEPAVLEDMIAFWVRKGKLRDVSTCADDCGSCGVWVCPFVMQMPKRYEFVEEELLHGGSFPDAAP